MIDAEQMDTFPMDRSQYRVYAAERARERQLAQRATTDYPDTTRPLSGPENEADA